MSIEASFDIHAHELIAHEIMDLYVDIFEVEKIKTMTSGEKPLNPALFGFTNETIPFDKLKENGQVEMEKVPRDFHQVKIHE